MTVYDVAVKLPPIDVLRDRCTALAVLERIIEGGEPYYTYTRQWGDDEAALEGQFLATAVLWRCVEDDRWHAGRTIVFPPSGGPYDTDPDGSGMLEILRDDIVDRYAEFATDYYEIDVDRAAVEHIVAHRPLTGTVVQALNSSTTVAELHDDLAAIGYPTETA